MMHLDLAKELNFHERKEGVDTILSFAGIVSGNLLIEHACRYLRTDFIFPQNKCKDKRGNLNTQEEFSRVVLKVNLKENNEKHGVNASCMLLDNKNVHFSHKEGQILFANPSFIVKKALFRPPGFNILDTDPAYFTYEVELVPNGF